MKSTVKYCSISNSQARSFLLDSHAEREQISISDAMFWVAAYREENIIGVVGLNLTKQTARIKAFYVKKDERKKAIGKGLLKFLIDKDEITSAAIKSKSKTSVFATKWSKNLFENIGFKIIRVNKKNNVSYMEKIKGKDTGKDEDKSGL